MDILEGRIESVKPEWSEDYSIGVVMASAGYPVKV